MPLSEFHKSKTTKDGASYWCKKCDKKHKRQYYASNKEKIAEKHRQYRTENKERIAEYKRKYRADNKEQIADRERKYRADNKDRIAERRRLYRAELPHAYIKGLLTIQHIPILILFFAK